jgi:hypothetical protein
MVDYYVEILCKEKLQLGGVRCKFVNEKKKINLPPLTVMIYDKYIKAVTEKI